MKKSILYLSLVSTLVVPNGLAAEETEEQKINRLEADLAKMTEKVDQEKATKEALRREIVARDREQKETKHLLNQVLLQLIPQDVNDGVPEGGLCKALHNPPYAKKSIMRSNVSYAL